jgi:hypothetical protein
MNWEIVKQDFYLFLVFWVEIQLILLIFVKIHQIFDITKLGIINTWEFIDRKIIIILHKIANDVQPIVIRR